MHDSLDLAHNIAQQRNWSELTQYLQDFLIPWTQQPPEHHHWHSQWLPLALLVLDNGEFQEQWDVAKLFPLFGTEAIAPLLDRLQNSTVDPDVRWFVARILGEFRQPAVLTALVDLLQQDDSDELTNMVATALTGFGAEAIAPLSRLVLHAPTTLLAVRTLAQIRHSDSIPVLLQVSTHPQAEVRELAIEALSSFHAPQVPPVLLQALQDPVKGVRKAAVIGLGFRADLLDNLDLVHHLQPLLWDLQLEVCQQTAIALGRLGTEAAIDALLERLRSPYTPEGLQSDVVRSLIWTDCELALTGLQHLLDTPGTLQSAQVMTDLMTTVGLVANPQLTRPATTLLISLFQMHHPALLEPSVRQLLALALGQLGEAIARDALDQLLLDVDSGVQLHAIAALKQLDTIYFTNPA